MYDGLSKGFMRLSRRVTSPGAIKRAMRQMSELVHTPLSPSAKAWMPDIKLPDIKMPELKMPGMPSGPSPAEQARTDRAAGISEITDFGSNPGALRMLICVPPTLPASGAPLVVVLHGCGQNAAQFAGETGWIAMAARLGFAVVMPEQVSANNAGRCFNWFRADDITRDAGESLSIRQMVDTAVARQKLDPRRVYVVGLSAGGAMAAAMLAAYPDLFAAGASVAGLPVGCALDVASALKRMQRAGAETPDALAEQARAVGPKQGPSHWPRISIWQGDADHTVAPGNAEQLAAQFLALHGIEGAGTEVPAGQGTGGRLWRDPAGVAGPGGITVELRTVAGMGHGYPIAAGTPSDRFVLPVGVDATEALARFWGLSSVR